MTAEGQLLELSQSQMSRNCIRYPGKYVAIEVSRLIMSSGILFLYLKLNYIYLPIFFITHTRILIHL